MSQLPKQAVPDSPYCPVYGTSQLNSRDNVAWRNNYEPLEQRTGLGPTASTPCRGIKHIVQGIALGRLTCMCFALNGHKPYLFHCAFAPVGRSRLHITYTQGDALG